MDKKKATIQARQEREKALLLENLQKTPIIQAVCEKLSISRGTYYRWREDDKAFAKAADEALQEGSRLVNDLAENQLISAIKDKNMAAIIYWLRHHHPTYRNRIEVTTAIQEELTPEQEAVVREALRLASLAMPEVANADAKKTETLPAIFPEQKKEPDITNDNQKTS